MFRKHRLGERVFAALIMACLTAGCALSVGSSKVSHGDRVFAAGFPKRVGVATIVGNLAAQQDATSRLSRGLVDLGFLVVANNWDVDRILGRWAGGVDETIPEFTRRRLQERYGLEGVFVGILSQDKGNIINETRLSLRLISVPTGKLVWSANVIGGGLKDLSGGVKDTALLAVRNALVSLEKDLYDDPKPIKGGIGQASSVSQLKKSQAGKSD